MLAPHHGVHRQLEVVRLTTQKAHDRLGFVVGEPEGAVDIGRVGGRWRFRGTAWHAESLLSARRRVE
jgi:hypothetical protein